MRVFGRFLYALIMVGFFLLAFTYSRDLIQTKYLEDVFGASLTDTNSENPEFYYFYTSIPDYNKSEPIISIDMNGYQIRGYEVLTASVNNDGLLETTESIYLIVYSPTEDLSQVGEFYLEDDSDNIVQSIYLTRFKTLNLINGVNDEGTIYLDKSLFLEEAFTRIVLVDKSDNILLDAATTIQDSDFTIKAFIDDFYNANNQLPEVGDFAQMTGVNIYPNLTHVAEGYEYIFFVAMGIYFVVLIFMTYIIFFRKRKHY